MSKQYTVHSKQFLAAAQLLAVSCKLSTVAGGNYA